MLDFGSLGSDCLIPWKSVTFFRMMLLDAGPLGNSSPLFCDLYEKKIIVSIICGTGDIFIFCGVAAFEIDTVTGQGTRTDKFSEKIPNCL